MATVICGMATLPLPVRSGSLRVEFFWLAVFLDALETLKLLSTTTPNNEFPLQKQQVNGNLKRKRREEKLGTKDRKQLEFESRDVLGAIVVRRDVGEQNRYVLGIEVPVTCRLTPKKPPECTPPL